MPTSVRRPSPLGGDREIPPAIRQILPPETRNQPQANRNHPQANLDTCKIFPSQTKSQSLANIDARIVLATTNLEDLATRLQILRQRLTCLKTKSAGMLSVVYRDPPDPGPVVQNKLCSNTGFNAIHEEKEELAPGIPNEDKLLVFTGCNSRIQETSYKIADEPIKGEEISKQAPSLKQSKANHHLCLHPRCSTLCLMAENITQRGVVGRPQAGAVPRREGKEVAESSKEAEKRVLVINMAGAREARRPRFLAVGLFLSVLLVNSKQLIEHMRKVWKIRGELEVNALESEAGRKFLLVFSEEGDWKHTIVGGPWQCKGDVFLVDGIADGDDPSVALFTHVPMWVQFRNIPFYLLTKKLAFDLGECIGSTMKIDSNARGCINDKFIRTRVQLPLYKALQKELMLVDEITGEEVAVQIKYERLPNFCLFCGFIGHMEARCDVPVAGRKIQFNQDLRVPAIHFQDPRCWFLPEEMGQAPPQTPMTRLWRAPTPAIQEQKVNKSNAGGVEQVLTEVARLSVADNNMKEISVADKREAEEELEGSDMGQTKTVTTEEEIVPTEEGEKREDDKQQNSELTNTRKVKKWKRMAREGLGDLDVNENNISVTQVAGSVRPREVTQGEMGLEPATKKAHKLNSLAEEGEGREENGKENKELDGGMEATGLGAAGKLSGASVSARQDP